MNDSTQHPEGDGGGQDAELRPELYADLATAYSRFDPPPPGMVARMQAAARSESELVDLDLDLELLVLVERSSAMAGARGSSAYTLRFSYEEVDLLVRAAADELPDGRRVTRVDGWVVPPAPMTVRVLAVPAQEAQRPGPDAAALQTEVDNLGRFEFASVPPGMVRLLLLGDADHRLATPAFEL